MDGQEEIDALTNELREEVGRSKAARDEVRAVQQWVEVLDHDHDLLFSVIIIHNQATYSFVLFNSFRRNEELQEELQNEKVGIAIKLFFLHVFHSLTWV